MVVPILMLLLLIRYKFQVALMELISLITSW